MVTPIIVLSKVKWHIVFSDKFNVQNTSRILMYILYPKSFFYYYYFIDLYFKNQFGKIVIVLSQSCTEKCRYLYYIDHELLRTIISSFIIIGTYNILLYVWRVAIKSTYLRLMFMMYFFLFKRLTQPGIPFIQINIAFKY